jgi:F-type H+-transporting ATPase subunit a
MVNSEALGEAWLTRLFNTQTPGVGNSLLSIFGLHAENPKAPWADFIVMQILVALLMILLFLILRNGLSVTKPGILQQIFELVHGFVSATADEQVGHEGRKHVVLFETLFIFILLSNLIGAIPGFVSPTQFVYVPCGMAILAFLYYNIVGIRKLGPWHYTKQFFGPIPVLAPFMMPIEIISHLARPLSLTVRLFANMYAGEQVTMVFLSLTYFAVPVIFMGLHVFVALLQSYIFMLLTMIYIAGAVEEESH